MTGTPLSHLLKLGPDRVVASAAVARNGGEEGGALILFVRDRQPPLPLLFISGVVESLGDALRAFARAGGRAPEDPALALRFSLKRPRIEESHWAVRHDDSRVVDTIRALAATNALALELVMQDRGVCHLALPAGVTRLLADELRATL
ncbi:hypothetical protein J2847_001901 [Azospirillum agricola]|uniref:hypothetical protein n=1 Tax=Azospirillum agricola TaxID=1720247 RepID=UPI001AE37E30|nr:hypothetical protein [Azospirillum agricola]MBP2228610.1 hypothetical protein [Azospirillum agricola]